MDSVHDDGPDMDEIFADPEYAEWLTEMDAQRAADEAMVARRYEDEHRERFGNDFGGEGEPW